MKAIDLLKKSLAGALSFALVAVSPGLAPYEAMAQVRVAPVATPTAMPGLGTAPVDSGFEPAVGLPLSGVESASPLSAPTELPSLGTPALAPSERSVGLAAKGEKKSSTRKMPDTEPVPDGNNRPSAPRSTPGFDENGGFRQTPGGPDDRNWDGPSREDDGSGSDLHSRVRREVRSQLDGAGSPVSPLFDQTLGRVGSPELGPSRQSVSAPETPALSALEAKDEQGKKVEILPQGRPETGGKAEKAGPSKMLSVPGTSFNIPTRTVAIVTAVGAAVMVGMQIASGAPASQVLAMTVGAFLTWGLAVLPWLTIHEYAHAKTALKFNDKTAFAAGRVTLNPFKHVDPIGTVALPLFLILSGRSPFGWAKPVPVSPYLSERARFWVSFAGPLSNLGVAVGAAILYRVLAPQLGVYGLVPSILGAMVDMNLLLFVFNMLPLNPFDGASVWRRIPGFGKVIDLVPGSIGLWIGLLAFNLPPLSGFFGGILGAMHYFLIATPLPFVGSPFASLDPTGGFLVPAIALVGMIAAGAGGGGPGASKDAPKAGPEGPSAPKAEAPQPGSPDASGPAAPTPSTPAVDLIVELPEGKTLRRDLVPELFDLSDAGSIRAARSVREDVLRDLEAAGLDEALLRRFEADPQSAFKLIRTATLRVDADKEAAFRAELQARGFKIHDNRRIPLPTPVEPENHPNRKTVTLEELVGIVNAGSVQKSVEERLGPPGLAEVPGFTGRMARWIMGLVGAKNPEVRVAVIDSGVDKNASAALKRGIKKSVNVTDGADGDDIGHGTHVSDTALAIDPWQNSVVSIKAFKGGWATTEMILKALAAADAEDAIIVGNSWGDSSGDPKSPEAKLTYELAKKGRILVFAAGNAGPGKNTVGAPAIVVYNSPETGAPRVIAVAAADYRRLIARFSSRGEVSQALEGTEEGKTWPLRPDMTAMGVDLQAAVPGGRKGVMSGTSMATPNVWGAISLLARKHGVTEVGKALDEIAKKIVDTSVDTGRPSYEQGKGFMDVAAADKALSSAGLALRKAALGTRLGRRAALGAVRVVSSPKFVRYLAYGGIAFAAVKGALVGIAMPQLAALELGLGAVGAVAALATRWLGGKKNLERFFWAFAVGSLVAGGVGLAAAGVKAFAAAIAAAPVVVGSLGLQSKLLPNPADMYPQALDAARRHAKSRGLDASKLEFIGATGSMNRRTLTWYLNFRVPTGDRFEKVTVRYMGHPVGGFDMRLFHERGAAAQPGERGIALDEAAFASKVTRGPDAALGDAQRSFAGFRSDAVALEVGEDGALSYAFYSAEGPAVRVQAATGLAESLGSVAQPRGLGAAPEVEGGSKALQVLGAIAILALVLGSIGLSVWMLADMFSYFSTLQVQPDPFIDGF